MKLEYIDNLSALKFIIDSEDSEETEGAGILALRQEVVSLIEGISDKKGKKKPAGGATTSERMTSANIEFNEALLSQIPGGLQRRCIYSRIQNSTACKLRGFVLDSWLYGFSTANDLIEANENAGFQLEFIVELNVRAKDGGRVRLIKRIFWGFFLVFF